MATVVQFNLGRIFKQDLFPLLLDIVKILLFVY